MLRFLSHPSRARRLTFVSALYLGAGLAFAPVAAQEDLPRVNLGAPTIECGELPAHDSHAVHAPVVDRLREEARLRALRTLRAQRIVGEVEEGAAPDGSGPRIALTVRFRFPDVAGRKAQDRSGRFLTVQAALVSSRGVELARGESLLDWGDVRWVSGARYYRARPVEDVLVDFVRKGVDHSLKRLSSRLGRQPGAAVDSPKPGEPNKAK